MKADDSRPRLLTVGDLVALIERYEIPAGAVVMVDQYDPNDVSWDTTPAAAATIQIGTNGGHTVTIRLREEWD